jgi:hypothetical protein
MAKLPMKNDSVSAREQPGNKPERNVGGAPKGSRNHLTHGLYAYKHMIDRDGLDKRSSLYKALRLKEQELIDSLGGDPSPQERVIITDSVKVILYLSTCDTYLSQLKSFIRKGRPHPVLSVRLQLASHLRENLKTLGLKRVEKTLSLDDIKREILEGRDDDEPHT